jgi:hypothetical protein
VPCVVGPYTSISGTLTLLSSKVREKSVVSGEYADEEKLSRRLSAHSVDCGQQGAERYRHVRAELPRRSLPPFEGAGAISRWRFKLPQELRPFDNETISDVVMHLRYTARDGGARGWSLMRGRT